MKKSQTHRGSHTTITDYGLEAQFFLLDRGFCLKIKGSIDKIRLYLSQLILKTTMKIISGDHAGRSLYIRFFPATLYRIFLPEMQKTFTLDTVKCTKFLCSSSEGINIFFHFLLKNTHCVPF